jgi:hypothetical protein
MNLKNYISEDGDNVGAAIARICREVQAMKEQFLAEQGVTIEQAARYRYKYQRLWKEWLAKQEKGRIINVRV